MCCKTVKQQNYVHKLSLFINGLNTLLSLFIKGLNTLQCCSQRSDSSQMIPHDCNISHPLEQQRLGCWRGLFKGIILD